MYAVRKKYYYYQNTFFAPEDHIVAVFNHKAEAVEDCDVRNEVINEGDWHLGNGEYSRPEFVIMGINKKTAAKFRSHNDQLCELP
tara:strand:- start:8783 stop:9037 length:255 start_codon:yes stop_codon:yes gene_type:complete